MSKILLDTKTRIFFYEMEFMNQSSFYENSENHHEQILMNLQQNKPHLAADLVIENWMLILKHIPS
jgi:hypothetical protein